ncbi:phosphatidylserine decarboxylase family protein [Archaeoglobales archaeon]|nr:MAG: phosphatidylserine decarboxylase family protein [Archaeoglobales archaeon]
MIEKSGFKIIFIEVISLILFLYLNLKVLILIVLIALAFTLMFFRDLPRKIEEHVVSPADGKIDYIKNNRLEIFMSAFDCHVVRAPVGGVVKHVSFKSGKTPPAFKRVENAKSNEILIEGGDGLYKVVQIAGIFARQIVCYVSEGDVVEKGQKIGIVKFGSRVVLEVPEGYAFTKSIGEKVKAGETIAIKHDA